MPQTCRTPDFSIQLPDSWIDRSMIAWSAPPSGGPVVPNIMVAYDRPQAEEGLGAYVNRQLKDLIARARSFQLITRQDVMLAGRPAVELLFQWDGGAGPIKQRQVYSLLPDGRCITIVNTARLTEFADADAQFMQILNSFAWPAPAGAGAAGA
ncbi:DcrB-related protein [Nitrospirillum sp. BR 11828]|uniref:DcrB-related protein n=1 Tax=Nitrospirillum sp. BR 11828 TaxID=3104325 RepID=UPI002ACAFB42|nr:DcrB-related protein [Nitrospirillum sp. BR 11828]MDZ5645695.1 DcrB-related protein [Nitrospirillum sp. BR 11828]